jgi:hypothetical protein
MKFLRSVKGCTRMDHIRNEEIRTELEMYVIQDTITEYRIRWSAHLQGMDNSRLSKQALLYKPRGRKMWAVLGRDGQLMSEQETLLYLEVMMMMMMMQTDGSDDGVIAPKHVAQRHCNIIFLYLRIAVF